MQCQCEHIVIWIASCRTELASGRVDPRVGSGWVGSGRVGSVFFYDVMGRVGSGQEFLFYFYFYFILFLFLYYFLMIFFNANSFQN